MPNVTTLGTFIQHVKGVETMFVDNYFAIITNDNDYYINLNGFSQLDNSCKVAYNNVNGQWYFKFVKAD